MCTSFYPLRRGHLPYFTPPLQSRNFQIPSLNHTVPYIFCRKMHSIVYTLVYSTVSSHGIMKLKISFALFLHTCLSLCVIAFNFNYLAYCCYIAPPYVCYWHLYSDLLLWTWHARFYVSGSTVVGSWKWCRLTWNSVWLIVNMATVRNFCDVQGKLKLFVICRPANGNEVGKLCKYYFYTSCWPHHES